MDSDTISQISIPFFSGAIGYVTNWTGVWMLFNPVHFKGFRLPGLAALARLLPRKLQEIPGVMHGGVGWQGIIPSRAAKMGSISVDKGIAKLGGASDFYKKLEPDKIAEHILTTAERDIRDLVERSMQDERPQLWNDLPPRAREAVHERVRAQLPAIVHSVTDEIGNNIDQLLDVKLMVIRHIEAHPELANKIFLSVGKNELRFIINFGFFFGFLLGLPTIFLVETFPYWWALPIIGTGIGWLTNWLAIWMIFEPVKEHSFLGVKVHGLFLRRQHEVAEIYAEVISDDIITLGNIGEELLYGPRSDRTRQMLQTALAPAVDRASGVVQPAVRVAMGTREYDSVRESVATQAVDYTITPMTDPDFNRAQSAAIRGLITARMREMDSEDFSDMLRSAIKQDEWLLFLHGAVLGFGAGLIHLAIFGV
jgi:uncharacterized membrane protein YheB (UPF0754 family)